MGLDQKLSGKSASKAFNGILNADQN